MSEVKTLLEIDRELDALLDEIEEQAEENGSASPELLEQFQQFCQAESDKVDRIGRFLTLMDSRLKYCRQQAEHFQKRARTSDAKIVRTKNIVLYFLAARGLKKIDGKDFTLRQQKNSQDSVRITDEAAVPISYCRIDAQIDGVVWETALSLLPDDLSKSLESSIQETRPNADAIKAAAMRNEQVPGAEVRRGSHLRVV